MGLNNVLRRFMIPLVALSLLAMGCGDGGEDTDPAATAEAAGQPCTDASGCPSGQCINSVCVGENSQGAEPVAWVPGEEGEPAAPGAEPSPAPAAEPSQSCATAEIAADGTTLSGHLYLDTNQNDLSVYASGFDEGTDEPLSGNTIHLIGESGETQTASCDDGTYAFNELEDGVYVVAPEWSDGDICMQKNCPKRFPEAVREGAVTIVTFGDSVPVVGDPPMFPARLATLLEPLVPVDNRNVAVGGTTSPQWLPGTSNFENTLTPHIADADVMIVSIGGNDIMGFATNPANIADIAGAIEGAHDLVIEIVANVVTIANAIWAINPNVDLIYCLYPDYSQATNDQMWSLVNQFLGEGEVREILGAALAAIPIDISLVLADMFGAADGLPLDDYLYDSLHFNSLGQTLYAEEIFKALGGVLVGETPLAPTGATPLGLVKDYSLAP